MIAWVDTLQSFVPDLRRRPNAPNSRQRRCRRCRALSACRAPRAPRAPAHCVCPQPPLPARKQVDSACVPGYTIFRASLPTCICAPTARVLRTSPPSSRARWPPRPACPCVLSLPAFARARSGLLQHRLYVRLLPTLPCRGLSKTLGRLRPGGPGVGFSFRAARRPRPPWVEARRLQLQT